jgi:hypothetical protein
MSRASLATSRSSFPASPAPVGTATAGGVLVHSTFESNSATLRADVASDSGTFAAAPATFSFDPSTWPRDEPSTTGLGTCAAGFKRRVSSAADTPGTTRRLAALEPESIPSEAIPSGTLGSHVSFVPEPSGPLGSHVSFVPEHLPNEAIHSGPLGSHVSFVPEHLPNEAIPSGPLGSHVSFVPEHLPNEAIPSGPLGHCVSSLPDVAYPSAERISLGRSVMIEATPTRTSSRASSGSFTVHAPTRRPRRR